jgi:arylsulfatase A-like enzyme
MVTQGDRHAGRLLALLSELNLEKNTLVLFASDNGGVRGEGHELTTFDTMKLPSGATLRGQKGTLYEGGLRVPLVLRWPGRVQAGAVSAIPVSFADIFATLMHAVDGKTTAYGDGYSIFHLLRKPVERPLVWEDHRWTAATKQLRPDYASAVRLGDWKGVRDKPGSPLQVFHLKNDPGETNDLGPNSPMAARLAAAMDGQHTPPLPHLGDMQFVK